MIKPKRHSAAVNWVYCWKLENLPITGFEVPVGKDGKFLIDSVYFSGKGKVFYGLQIAKENQLLHY